MIPSASKIKGTLLRVTVFTPSPPSLNLEFSISFYSRNASGWIVDIALPPTLAHAFQVDYMLICNFLAELFDFLAVRCSFLM